MAPLTLVIGNKNYSSWSLRPWLLLKHLDVAFREILVPLDQPSSREDLEKYSPSGTRSRSASTWPSSPGAAGPPAPRHARWRAR